MRQITKSGRHALKELTTLKLYMGLITHAGTYVPICVVYSIVIIPSNNRNNLIIN